MFFVPACFPIVDDLEYISKTLKRVVQVVLFNNRCVFHGLSVR